MKFRENILVSRKEIHQPIISCLIECDHRIKDSEIKLFIDLFK